MKERAHSKYSASGAERWINCPGSVLLSEGLPDKSSPWAEEGTLAHKVLETMLIEKMNFSFLKIKDKIVPREMLRHAAKSARFLFNLHHKNKGSELLVETRIHLDFIDPEMFGTFDAAVIDYFGTLHIYDFKYGQNHAVSPVENSQMLIYGVGLAHKLKWNFKDVRLWIDQPRIRGYDGPAFWDVSIRLLRDAYLLLFRRAVDNVKRNPNKYVEGEWCWWCKAKSICPLKRQAKIDAVGGVFKQNTIDKIRY